MFADREATVMVPATDVERAKSWYGEKLGLKSIRTEEEGATYRLAGGAPMFLYKSDYAGTAKHTLISFKSMDLKADMQALRAKGLAFIDYDLPNLKTVDGIAEFGPVKTAWVHDSEGNILGFMEGM